MIEDSLQFARATGERSAASSPDLVILGSGSTAFAAALRAQAMGKTVLMIERSDLGGTCVNWGCVPSKTLIHDARFRHRNRRWASPGSRPAATDTEISRLVSHRDEVVHYLRRTKYLDVLHNVPGLEVVKGSGRFTSPTTVTVGERKIEAERFLVATGGFPHVIRFPGLHEVDYLTSRTALLLREFPKSLIIIGGGVIALELGQMFHRLGTQVSILEHGSRLLPQVDPEVVEPVHRALSEEGIEIVTGVSICSVSKVEEGTAVTFESDGKTGRVVAQRLLVATGTAPASNGIGLDAAGVETDAKGFIKIDRRMRTTAPGIWAAGDVTGGMMIATVGAREGVVAVDDMFNPECGCAMDYLAAPMAIFTDPEIGIVGHTADSARAAGIETVTSVLPASVIPKAHITGETAGVIKMVADAVTGRILGVHLACHRGADIINEAAIAIRCRMTVDDLATALHVYPTMAEGLRLCAQGFRRDVKNLSCCAE